MPSQRASSSASPASAAAGGCGALLEGRHQGAAHRRHLCAAGSRVPGAAAAVLAA